MSCDVGEATKGLEKSCDVGKATEGLENELWRKGWRMSSEDLILQPFFRFSYVTSSSLTSPGEPPMKHIIPAKNECNKWSVYTVYKHYTTPPLYQLQPAGALQSAEHLLGRSIMETLAHTTCFLVMVQKLPGMEMNKLYEMKWRVQNVGEIILEKQEKFEKTPKKIPTLSDTIFLLETPKLELVTWIETDERRL